YAYREMTTTESKRLLGNEHILPSDASRGILHFQFPMSYTGAVYFNMDDTVVGGLDPGHVALRRAIALGLDVDRLIKIVYGGQAVSANQLVPPGVTGHDPTVPAKSNYDPAAANALLDRF